VLRRKKEDLGLQNIEGTLLEIILGPRFDSKKKRQKKRTKNCQDHNPVQKSKCLFLSSCSFT
jgi:hypothetical protein